MPTHDASGTEEELILRRANEVVKWMFAQRPKLGATATVEALAHALRLLYATATPEFKREMHAYLTANLAEMKDPDA